MKLEPADVLQHMVDTDTLLSGTRQVRHGYTRQEIARTYKVSWKTANKALEALLKSGVVKAKWNHQGQTYWEKVYRRV